MKILEVASSLKDWGGIERYVLYLTEGLVSRGHLVEATCPPGSPLAQNLKVPHHRLALRGKHSLIALARYLRLLRAQRYDLLHVHFSPDFLMPAYAAKLAGRPKVVLTRHVALRWSSRKAALYGRVFDHIIPVADAVRENLLESGIPAAKMTVAKAGCPALSATRSRSEIRKEFGFEGFTIGCFGRLVKEKGVDVLLRAASGLDASVHIFGEGPKRTELEQGASANVRFHGFVPEIADPMSAVDLVVISSTWAEAFPYAALEAMSLARPLLVSDVGGLPELVQDGVNGRLFESGNSVALAEKANDFISNQELCQTLGIAGREIQSSQFTIGKMAERIEAVFEHVIKSSN